MASSAADASTFATCTKSLKPCSSKKKAVEASRKEKGFEEAPSKRRRKQADNVKNKPSSARAPACVDAINGHRSDGEAQSDGGGGPSHQQRSTAASPCYEARQQDAEACAISSASAALTRSDASTASASLATAESVCKPWTDAPYRRRSDGATSAKPQPTFYEETCEWLEMVRRAERK